MDLGLTQREVARRLRVDPWTLLNWECGKRRPARRHVDRIADFLRDAPAAAANGAASRTSGMLPG
jgi:transcriptional regulator with XRE-family HTH domain